MTSFFPSRIGKLHGGSQGNAALAQTKPAARGRKQPPSAESGHSAGHGESLPNCHLPVAAEMPGRRVLGPPKEAVLAAPRSFCFYPACKTTFNGTVTVGVKSDLLCQKRGGVPPAAELDFREHYDRLERSPCQVPCLLLPFLHGARHFLAPLASSLAVKPGYSHPSWSQRTKASVCCEKW